MRSWLWQPLASSAYESFGKGDFEVDESSEMKSLGENSWQRGKCTRSSKAEVRCGGIDSPWADNLKNAIAE